MLVTTEFVTVKKILYDLPSAWPLPCHVPSRGPAGDTTVGVGELFFSVDVHALKTRNKSITNKYCFFMHMPQESFDVLS